MRSAVWSLFSVTPILKIDKLEQKTLAPGLSAEELGKTTRIRDLKIEREDGDVQFFQQGTYNSKTGGVKYTLKTLPKGLEKLTQLHKASTKQPLFYLNIFFGLSLLFFVISSFWMFMPKTAIFKKGIYFTLAGIILTVVLLYAR